MHKSDTEIIADNLKFVAGRIGKPSATPNLRLAHSDTPPPNASGYFQHWMCKANGCTYFWDTNFELWVDSNPQTLDWTFGRVGDKYPGNVARFTPYENIIIYSAHLLIDVPFIETGTYEIELLISDGGKTFQEYYIIDDMIQYDGYFILDVAVLDNFADNTIATVKVYPIDNPDDTLNVHAALEYRRAY